MSTPTAPPEVPKDSPDNQSGKEEVRMPLWEHLADLRSCLIRALIALFVGVCITWSFCEKIVLFLEKPLLKILPKDSAHLYFTGVADKFLIYFKVAMLAAVGLTSPYLLYQLWIFISPALHRKEKRFVVPFVFFGTVTFIGGLAFAYYFVLPFGYKYLIEFGNPAEVPIITLTEYFGLTIKMLLTMGVVFELPMIMVLLAKFGIVKAEFLTRHRRHAVLAVSILAAIVSPTPDAFTMILTMAPLYLLLNSELWEFVLRANLRTTDKKLSMRRFFILLALFICGAAHAGYRVYVLKLKEYDAYGHVQKVDQVTSTLDPFQYEHYYGGYRWYQVNLVEYLVLPARHSHFRKYCEKPKVQVRGPASLDPQSEWNFLTIANRLFHNLFSKAFSPPTTWFCLDSL